jgi:GT2 family glycosyltransferase
MPPPIQDVLRHLSARGLVDPHATPAALPLGNRDRAADHRASWRIRLPDGRTARLVLSPQAMPEIRALEVLNRDHPGLAPRLLFTESNSDRHLMAEEFIAGIPLSDCSSHSPAQLSHAVARLWHRLTRTGQPSTEDARHAEWTDWSEELSGLPVFSGAVGDALRGQVLPPLYHALTTGIAPARRISNGDLTAPNLLLTPDDELRLIDWEFSRRTHFAREDAVRFHVLSPIARLHPHIFASIPRPGPAWHLYFWLRQLALEFARNSPAYLDKHVPERLALIRLLAENLFAVSLPAWPCPPLALHAHLEVRGSGLLRGWCHVPSTPALRAVMAYQGDDLLEEVPPVPRPDVQAHFAGAPNALATGFCLPASIPVSSLCLCVQTAEGVLLPFPAASTLPVAAPAALNWLRHSPDRWPLLSLVLPLFRPPLHWLTRAIESVLAQTYPHWELQLIDDGSAQPELTAFIQDLARRDARIHVLALPGNQGISAATNHGIARAKGDYLAFLDQDDELARDALAAAASAILDQPAIDVLYTDQDKCDDSGRRFSAFRKPVWDPVYILGVMYAGHLLVARTALVRRVGGCDSRFDRVQDYELLLRLAETAPCIHHLPRVLYHWRALPGSIALASHAKGPIDSLQVAAVQAHLDRRGLPVQARAHPRVAHRVELVLPPAASPTVTCILPANAIAPPAFSFVEMVRLGPEASAGLAQAEHAAASIARGEYLVFLAGDFIPGSPDWLSLLLAPLRLPGIGASSPLVLRPAAHAPGEADFVAPPDLDDSDAEAGAWLCARTIAAVSPYCSAWHRETYLSLQTAGALATIGLAARMSARGLRPVRVGGARLLPRPAINNP